MFIKSALLAGIGLVVVLALTAIGSTPQAEGNGSASYEVTVRNLAYGQPLSPLVAATHRNGIRMFEVGKLASPGLEAIAEDGDNSMMFMRFDGSAKATEAVAFSTPLTPSGTVVGTFTDSVTFPIMARPGDRLSLATMLICTNDGFTGLDAVKLPKDGSVAFILNGYDAGTEDNTEASGDIVDPCSGLGPTPLAGDPNGNADAAVDTMPHQVIQHHPGIMGGGELTMADHGWTNPVALVTIVRMP